MKPPFDNMRFGVMSVRKIILIGQSRYSQSYSSMFLKAKYIKLPNAAKQFAFRVCLTIFVDKKQKKNYSC